MELTLTEDEATELRDLLDGSLGDLSSEIADTDNPGYRLGLKDASGAPPGRAGPAGGVAAGRLSAAADRGRHRLRPPRAGPGGRRAR